MLCEEGDRKFGFRVTPQPSGPRTPARNKRNCITGNLRENTFRLFRRLGVLGKNSRRREVKKYLPTKRVTCYVPSGFWNTRNSLLEVNTVVESMHNENFNPELRNGGVLRKYVFFRCYDLRAKYGDGCQLVHRLPTN